MAPSNNTGLLLAVVAVVCCMGSALLGLVLLSGNKGATSAQPQNPYEGLPATPVQISPTIPDYNALQAFVNNLFYNYYSPNCWNYNRFIRTTVPALLVNIQLKHDAEMRAAKTVAQRKSVIQKVQKATMDIYPAVLDTCSADTVIMAKTNGVFVRKSLAEAKTEARVHADALAVELA